MGTRADFYVGIGKDAEWLGSVAFDGDEWGEAADSAIREASTEAEYREAVAAELAGRDDATLPEHGWPWPWNDSNTTDYAYTFLDGRVQWEDLTDWPDMRSRKNVTFGPRSGVIVAAPPQDHQGEAAQQAGKVQPPGCEYPACECPIVGLNPQCGKYTGKYKPAPIQQAAPAPVVPGDSYDDLFNGLQRVDTAAVLLPTYRVRHEGGIDAFVSNIVEAIADAARMLASPSALRIDADKLHREIMNLPDKCSVITHPDNIRWYRSGHRDARHAAAELVSDALGVPVAAKTVNGGV